MKGWQLKRIDELGKIITGKTPSSNNPDEFGFEYPFITPTDMHAGKKVIVERFLSEKGKEKHNRIKLPRKTTCVVCIASVGKVCMTSKLSFSNQQINSIISNKENDPDFVYYLATTLNDALIAFAGGSATPIINKSVFSSIKVNVPWLPIQRKIAAVLSAYDDLIENNNRRIAILENMAAELYREWFVRLRFPGHDSVGAGLKPAPSKGVPEGWEVKKLSDVVELAYGKALKEEDRVDGPYPVYGSSGIVGFHNHALVKGPGIIVGRKGNVGSVIWSSLDFFPIDTTYYVKSKFPFEYVYYLIQSMNFINNDAAVPGLNREQAYANKFYFPPLSLIDSFAAMAKPFFTQKNSLKKQNEFLEISRDRLLSRLMSGKIDVENLDIQFPDSMKEEAAANA